LFCSKWPVEHNTEVWSLRRETLYYVFLYGMFLLGNLKCHSASFASGTNFFHRNIHTFTGTFFILHQILYLQIYCFSLLNSLMSDETVFIIITYNFSHFKTDLLDNWTILHCFCHLFCCFYFLIFKEAHACFSCINANSVIVHFVLAHK
jgi:hypothetical protein